MSGLRRRLATFVGEWHGQYRDVMDVHARDALHERRWDPVRSRRARLALVAIGAVLVLLAVPAFLLSSAVGIAAAVGLAACWYLLRRSLRELGDLPERVLDERQVALRNRAYRIAWKAFMGFFTLLLALTAGMLYGISTSVGDGEGLGPADGVALSLAIDVGFGIVVAFAGIVSLLPYAVLAWLEPGESPERERPDLRVLG